MHLMLVTDAWFPQVNGVVRSLDEIVRRLRKRGDTVTVISPDRFVTIPCPTYPEVRLSLTGPWRLGSIIEKADPDFIHIATEGPLGAMARWSAQRAGRGFTTSYHTRFPEYLAARTALPAALTYAAMRRFHNSGLGCMVATRSLKTELEQRGFQRLTIWPRGVDAELFQPRPRQESGRKGPIFLSVGRLAVEKNVDAFLSLDLPGTKVVVGDGPERQQLERRYPDAVFTGTLHGEALARAYASADVFVFPSITDTFGNVILEALACGVPVAAFPVTGPNEIITSPTAGVLDVDLRRAALAALDVPRDGARAHALLYDWEESARIFRSNVLNSAASALRTVA